jgi:arsenite methyltransferase
LTATESDKPDYGVDAPKVIRNLLGAGGLAAALAAFGPATLTLGPVMLFLMPMWLGIAVSTLLPGFAFLYYVRAGKLRHRDALLALHRWRGDEQVLDVGCGRGLLLAGAAKALGGGGSATGLDIWSSVDLGGNSAEAAQRNLVLEGVAQRCRLVEQPAETMAFPDASFDLVLSNMCLHNIRGAQGRRAAIRQIARVLKPGGMAILSDFVLTGTYARWLAAEGLAVERRWTDFGRVLLPIRIVIARKPSAV